MESKLKSCSGAAKLNCLSCNKVVKNNAIECDLCKNWYHFKCMNIPSDVYAAIGKYTINWHCNNCQSVVSELKNSSESLKHELELEKENNQILQCKLDEMMIKSKGYISNVVLA